MGVYIKWPSIMHYYITTTQWGRSLSRIALDFYSKLSSQNFSQHLDFESFACPAKRQWLKNQMQLHKIFDPIALNILDITICRIKNLLKCLLWRRQISTHVTKTGLKFIKGLVRQITAYLQLQSIQYKIDHSKNLNNSSSHLNTQWIQKTQP